MGEARDVLTESVREGEPIRDRARTSTLRFASQTVKRSNRGKGYQTTIQALQGLRAYLDPEYLKMEAIIPKVIPEEMQEWFNSPEGKWFKKEIADISRLIEKSWGASIRQVTDVEVNLA